MADLSGLDGIGEQVETGAPFEAVAYAYFEVTGTDDKSHPDRITRLTGLQPSKAVYRGAPYGNGRASRHRWILRSELGREAPVDEQLDSIYSQLAAVSKSARKRLRKLDTSLHVVAYSAGSGSTFFVTHEWFKLLLKWRAAFRITARTFLEATLLEGRCSHCGLIATESVADIADYITADVANDEIQAKLWMHNLRPEALQMLGIEPGEVEAYPGVSTVALYLPDSERLALVGLLAALESDSLDKPIIEFVFGNLTSVPGLTKLLTEYFCGMELAISLRGDAFRVYHARGKALLGLSFFGARVRLFSEPRKSLYADGTCHKCDARFFPAPTMILGDTAAERSMTRLSNSGVRDALRLLWEKGDELPRLDLARETPPLETQT